LLSVTSVLSLPLLVLLALSGQHSSTCRKAMIMSTRP
jgi:hypothetical protein